MEFRSSYGEFSPSRATQKSLGIIKEEEEEDDETRRDLHPPQRNEGSKSPSRFIAHSEDGHSETATVEESPVSASSNSSSPVFRRAKRSNSIKNFAPSMEFPVLVRGIDMDSRKTANLALKDVDIGFPLKKQNDEKNRFRPQNKTEIEVISIPSSRNIKTEENTINFIENDSFEEASGDERGTSQQLEESYGVNEAIPEIFNTGNLKSLFGRSCKPEEMVFLAINDQNLQLPENKSAFWNKLGYKEKKNDTTLMEVALKEWEKLEKQKNSLAKQNFGLKAEYEHLLNLKKKCMEDYRNIRMDIKSVLSKITEQNVQGVLRYDELGANLEDERIMQEELINEEEIIKNHYLMKLERSREYEEMWMMKIEDLRFGLVNTMSERIRAQEKCEKNQILIKKLKNEEELQRFQKEQIELGLEMLGKTLEFFSESQEHVHFNTAFCEALKRLREASFEAIEAEKQFEMQANTDPRELIPYTRVSETGPSKKANRISML